MRLLEPLMGIRMSAGHAVYHVAAFIVMILIDPMKTHSVSADTLIDHHDVVIPDDELHRQLAALGQHNHPTVGASAKMYGYVFICSEGDYYSQKASLDKGNETMIWLFTVIRDMHFTFYLCYIAFSVAKRFEFTFFSNVLQIIMPVIYGMVINYAIYFVKRCQEVLYDTNTEVTYGEMWILIEVMIFFLRLISGMFFLLFNYLAKVDVFVRPSFLLENDDNPWNNKDTEDFMRHLKIEYFLVTQQVTGCLLPFIIGFFDYFTWIEIVKFGPRDFMVSQIMIVLALLPRISLLLTTLYAALSGKNFNGPIIKKA